MIRTYARRICHVVAAVSFLVRLGLVGGIEHGGTLTEAKPATLVCLVAVVLSVLVSELIGEEDGEKW